MKQREVEQVAAQEISPLIDTKKVIEPVAVTATVVAEPVEPSGDIGLDVADNFPEIRFLFEETHRLLYHLVHVFTLVFILETIF